MESVTKFFKEENDFLYRKGEVRGIEKGIEKGIERGEHNKAMKVAREFKKMGISTEDIAKGNGLSIEEIEKL